MTKNVRIENADLNLHDKVRVTTQIKNPQGEWIDSPHELPVDMPYPCQVRDFGIWGQKRLVIEEYQK